MPRKYGIRHTLGENGGPGGLFFTLRTLPLVFDLARDMQALCPNALYINFSNPENRIILASGSTARSGLSAFATASSWAKPTSRASWGCDR